METIGNKTNDVNRCKFCNTIYKTRSGLWKHINKYHVTNDFEMTSECSKMTSNDFKMETKEIVCEYCSKSFSRRNNLNYHMKNRCKKITKLLEEKEYLKQIEDLKKRIESIEKCNKTTKIIINTQNNINNKININYVGQENINLLTTSEKKFVLSQGMGEKVLILFCIIKK